LLLYLVFAHYLLVLRDGLLELVETVAANGVKILEDE
jgi:hypothetical protein